MQIQLHGSGGTRTLTVRSPQATTPKETPSLQLSPATLFEVLRTMKRRWYNVDEIVTQLKDVHGISTNARVVATAAHQCELERKGIGTQMEVRRHDDAASKRPRKACFAASRRLRSPLKLAGISEEALWDWVKAEYNVESRTQMCAHQWSALSAHFNACLRNHQLLHSLIQQIKRVKA